MTQHLNLLGPGLHQQRQRWTLAQGLAGLGLLALACLAAGLVMDSLATRAQAGQTLARQAGDSARHHLAELQAQARSGPGAGIDAELAQLRRQIADLDRVRALVASGAVGRPQGHAELLLALARQADPAVWITGLQVSADHATLELRGRMVDPAALPVYLGRLQHEPAFHGRRFAQLQLRRVTAQDADTGAAAGNTTTVAALAAVTSTGTTAAGTGTGGTGGTIEFILRSPAPTGGRP
ncbi:MAG: hypothetical protein RLZZ584_4536 [Pseudomonadota bacterium]|jgi:Tfp pilus assembly protein PilN